MSFKSMLANLQAASGIERGRGNASSASSSGSSQRRFAASDTLLTRTSALNSVNILRGRPKKEATKSSGEVNVAVCCTVVDSFPQEDAWRAWLEGGGGVGGGSGGGSNGSDTRNGRSAPPTGTTGTTGTTVAMRVKASLHIHAKHPERIRSAFVSSKLIESEIKPEWNDVRVIEAMLLLLRNALKNPATDFVVFTTESCIPIATLEQVGKELSLSKKSWLRYYCNDADASKYDQTTCFLPLESVLPPNCIAKSLPGWISLTRKHAESILSLPQKLEMEVRKENEHGIDCNDFCWCD